MELMYDSFVTRVIVCVVVGVAVGRWWRGRRRKLPPGPRPWPIVGNLLQLGPLPHRDMLHMYIKYGPLVYLRLGCVHVVTTNDPHLIKEFVSTQDEVFANRPKTLASQFLAYEGNDIALAPYGPHWKEMRRICMEHLLTTKRLESFQHYRAQEAQSMVRSIWEKSLNGETVNLKEVLGGFSMNIMTRMLLGKSYFGAGNAGPQEAQEFLSITHQVFWLLGVFNLSDYLPFLRPFDIQGYEKLMKEVCRRMDSFHSSIVEEHRKKLGDEPHDFVDILLSLPGRNHEEHLTDIEMKALVQDMIAGAIDTSSITSEWAMSEMLCNPNTMKKAREEIDSLVGMDRVVQESDLGQLRYLKAVVKEIFRTHPPGPFLITHESIKDTQVMGYDIPKGTHVLVNTYALGKNPKLWGLNIEEFNPERWLDEDKVEIRDANYRIIPFGGGRRKCPGAPLGQTMVLLALAHLIHSFEWSIPPPLTPENLDMTEAPGLTSPRSQPLIAVAIPRLHNSLYY